MKIKTISVCRTLYLTHVRSHLAYASQVWAPRSVDLIRCIERVQRLASKYILDLPFFCDINCNNRLSTLNLPPLCYGHELLEYYSFSNHNITLLTYSAAYYHNLKTQINVPDLQTLTAYNFTLEHAKQLLIKTLT